MAIHCEFTASDEILFSQQGPSARKSWQDDTRRRLQFALGRFNTRIDQVFVSISVASSSTSHLRYAVSYRGAVRGVGDISVSKHGDCVEELLNRGVVSFSAAVARAIENQHSSSGMARKSL